MNSHSTSDKLLVFGIGTEMRRPMRLTLVLILMILSNSVIFAADKVFVLYGFKLGQSISTAQNQFGKPFKSHKFDDGFSYEAFKLKDHILVVEANNTRPDLIWAIQIQGKSNPEFHGLVGLNLGDKSSKIIELFGEPDEKRTAVDEKTQEKMEGIQYYSYDTSRNFSIETTNNLVTSIKLSFRGYVESEDRYELQSFIDTLNSKDLSKIASNIATDFILKKNKEYKIETSILETIKGKNEINKVLFNANFGIATLTAGDILESIPIKKEEIIMATYFKIKKKEILYHLFFLRNYDGWVLKEVNFDP